MNRIVAVLALSTGWLTAVPIADASAATTTRYVSPSGTGTSCSTTAPCSLATAQAQVRSAALRMTGDLVVQLAGGTYRAPLSFTAADSGTNGHVVRYQSAPGQRAVISGGRSITGWTVQNAAKNIWKASLPVGFAGRQLYVDGARATLAAARTSDVLGALTYTATGYTASTSAMATWYRPQDTEFVYPAGGHDPAPNALQTNPWTWNLCSVNSVSGTAVTMERGCFRNGRGFPTRQPNGQVTSSGLTVISKPTYVQNNYSLLSEPGEFYVDPSGGKIYYIPRSGQRLDSADVVLAHEQNLLSAVGTASKPVHDMQFVGLSFEYGTFVPDKYFGVVNFQGSLLLYALEETKAGYEPSASLPSNVSFVHAERVLFQGNSLTHLGATGVGFTGGGSSNTVLGNSITDVSGSGIMIGEMIGIDFPTSYESATVSNNYVRDVAKEYESGAGIIVGWSQHSVVTHNEVSDTFIGIQLGNGSRRKDHLHGDNHIDYNYIHDVHASSLGDGGAIYVTGWQTSSPESTISHNYISGDAARYGAIYLDMDSTHWRVTDNVIRHVADSSGWLFLQNLYANGWITATYNTVTGNYSDTTRRFASQGGDDRSNTIANNRVGLTSWPAAAQTIITGAGLTSSWTSIRGGPRVVNLAYRTPVMATSNAAAAARANDGDASTAWTSAAGDGLPAWETDLGKPLSLTKVTVLTRQDADQPSAQNSFQVWVSNTAVMSAKSSVVACTQGADRLAFRATYTCTLPAGTWRYVALFKTVKAPYSLGEVRIFGQA